jgi:RNA polymerase sigma-70 factor (ECF subfamily)
VNLTSSRSDAEELLSELFFGIVKKRLWVAQADNVRVYLFAMARNLAHEMHRKRRRRQEHHEAYTDYLELCDDPSGPWSQTEARHLQESFSVLSPEQREVVILRIYDDLTFAETAWVLRISQNTVASRYRYALAKLREQLKEEAHDA